MQLMAQQMQVQQQQLKDSLMYNAKSYQTIQGLTPHIQRYNAMEKLLTDPNQLAAYTVDYFTYVQPLPQRPNAAPLVRPEFPSMPVGNGNGNPNAPRLSDIHPALRWKASDQLEKQNYFNQKLLVAVD